jgi:uncharacterized repeat protein (TIGR03803 family)
MIEKYSIKKAATPWSQVWSINISRIISFSLVGILFLSGRSFSQSRFLGMTSTGGEGYGTIFETDNNGNNVRLSSSFTCIGKQPGYTQLIEVSSQKLYGMTTAGGASDAGVIFEYDHVAETYIKVMDFSPDNGSTPWGSLVKAPNGKLYGMTAAGGANDKGVIFEFDYLSRAYQKLFEFSIADGGSPFGSLIHAANGKLYGMTSTGGVHDAGVIFEYDYVNKIFQIKINLAPSTGSNPRGSLMQASNGKLYGMTYSGGANDGGVIFEYDYVSNVYQKKIDLNDSHGKNPHGSLLQASNGKLYGLTFQGGANNAGVIFEYDILTNGYVNKIDFSAALGKNPYGSLIQAIDGKLYGMTSTKAALKSGMIFKYDYTNNTCSPTGATMISAPTYSSLVQVSDGRMFTMTMGSGAGKNLHGVITEIQTNDISSDVVYFNYPIVRLPHGSLAQTADGKLYGLSIYDSDINCDLLFPTPCRKDMVAVFEYDYSTGAIKRVSTVFITSGFDTDGTLVLAPNGKLYGIATFGGIYERGTLIEFTPGEFVSSKVDFKPEIGTYPIGSLLLASNGKFYGSTAGASSGGSNVIFEYDYIANTCSSKASIAGGLGSFEAFTEAPNRKLYGMTSEGGANNNGTIFEYNFNTHVSTRKIDLTSENGASPYGALVLADNGRLYGLTTTGGANNAGVIFEYDYTTNTYTKKIDFGSAMGARPEGSLMMALNGKLYGVTKQGGIYDKGVIFEYDHLTNTYTKKFDFSGTDGQNPGVTKLIEVFPLNSYITSQPSNTSSCVGATASFGITTSRQDISYQWQVNQGSAFNNIAEGGSYSGTTSPTLSISNVTLSMNYQYRCVLLENDKPSGVSKQVFLKTGLPYQGNRDLAICSGDSVILGGMYRKTAGTYYDQLTSSVGCDSIVNTLLSIRPLPNVNFSLDTTVILTDDPLVLTGGSPEGGIYSGTAVTNGVFYPALAGIGEHPIEYNYVDMYNCGSSDAGQISVNNITAVDHPHEFQSVTVSPNPAANTLIIAGAGNHASIKMYDYSGTVVYDSPNFSSHLKVDLSPYPYGLYLILINDGGTYIVHKIIHRE